MRRSALMGENQPAPGSPSTNVRLRTLAARGPIIGRVLGNGKLVIEECVGHGGVGTVYRAQHRSLRMPVAVKLMHEQYEQDPAFCARFRAEALSASRLDHPNLTRVLDYGQEEDGLLYIAMEFLDGFCLRDVLTSEGHFPLLRAAKILFQVCAALSHAHARGTVHRDIKPENIVLVQSQDDDGNETEVVKVCDFGIAQSNVVVGSAASFAGTAEYMSPELLEGHAADARSDVYACGVLLYELLTGSVPIPGDQAELAERIRRVVLTPPSKLMPDLDVRVDAVVMKALEKDPNHRHAGARELRIELRAALEMLSAFSAEGQWAEIDPPSTRLVAAVGREDQDQDPRQHHDPHQDPHQHPAATSPVANEAATAPTADDSSDWLEHGTGYFEALSQPSTIPPRPAIVSTLPPPGQASLNPISGVRAAVRASQTSMNAVVVSAHSSAPPPASAPPPSEDATRATAEFLRNLAETHDPVKFAAVLAMLTPRVRTMLEHANADPLWRLCSTLEMIATDTGGGSGSRAEQAQSFLTLFADVQLLGPLAQKTLEALQDGHHAPKLIVRAGNFGAHALYSARVKDQHPVFETRERFITTLRQIGPPATPTIRDALSLLDSKLDLTGAISVAEDLLQAIDASPSLLDNSNNAELFVIVFRYAQSTVKSLALLATEALARLDVERARPLLVAHLRHEHDEIVLAALAHLRHAGALDEEIIEQLRPIVSGHAPRSPLVRRAATEALVDAAGPALPLARWVLYEAFKAMAGTTPEADDLLITIATSLIAIGGDEAISTIRSAPTLDPLVRERLDALTRRSRPD